MFQPFEQVTIRPNTFCIYKMCVWPDGDLLRKVEHVASLHAYTLGGFDRYYIIMNLQHIGISSLKIHRVRHAVRPHATALLPLDRISWNLTLEKFTKILLAKFQVLFKSEQSEKLCI